MTKIVQSHFIVEMMLIKFGADKKAQFVFKTFSEAQEKLSQILNSPRKLKEKEYFEAHLLHEGRLIQKGVIYGPFDFKK